MSSVIDMSGFDSDPDSIMQPTFKRELSYGSEIVFVEREPSIVYERRLVNLADDDTDSDDIEVVSGPITKLLFNPADDEDILLGQAPVAKQSISQSLVNPSANRHFLYAPLQAPLQMLYRMQSLQRSSHPAQFLASQYIRDSYGSVDKFKSTLGHCIKNSVPTSGSVCVIAQFAGHVAACSSATMGLLSDDHNMMADPGPANTSGNIQAWNTLGQEYILEAHQRPIRRGSPNKYYTVTDVAFDPYERDPENPWLLSAGGDGEVCVWTAGEDDGDEGLTTQENMCLYPWRSRETPHAYPTLLRFCSHPKSNHLLAIGCSNGVYVYQDYQNQLDNHRDALALNIDGERGNPVGEVLWGLDGWIFASSESASEGLHYATNLSAGRRTKALHLCSKGVPLAESGDAMALTPNCSILALLTRDLEGKHTMHLFDAEHQNFEDPVQAVTLQPFGLSATNGQESEITSAKFSPDGLLVALSRSDNSTHVYDTRSLPHGPLFQLRHRDVDRNEWTGSSNYGVTHIEWVTEWYGGADHGLGLVSGGGDGELLLWDLLSASEGPKKVAEVQYGITTFSLGDRKKGEKSLVIGDCGGNVYIYD